MYCRRDAEEERPRYFPTLMSALEMPPLSREARITDGCDRTRYFEAVPDGARYAWLGSEVGRRLLERERRGPLAFARALREAPRTVRRSA